MAAGGDAGGPAAPDPHGGGLRRRAIRRVTGAPVRIKWPNDLVLEGRKLAGILTEASLSGRGVDYVVIGIGVNLRQRSDDFSPEVARIATSLEAQGYPADGPPWKRPWRRLCARPSDTCTPRRSTPPTIAACA